MHLKKSLALFASIAIILASPFLYNIAVDILPVFAESPISESANPEPVFIAEYFLPVTFSISNLAINLPIEHLALHNNQWIIPETQVAYLTNSAVPTQAGNIVLYGHNTPEVLGKLSQVKIGETIELELVNGMKRRYEIRTTEIVEASEVDILAKTDEETLTIFTCAGWFDAQRLVIVAKPIK